MNEGGVRHQTVKHHANSGLQLFVCAFLVFVFFRDIMSGYGSDAMNE